MKNRYIQIFSFLIALLSFATFPACEVDDEVKFVTEQEPVTKPELTLPKVSNPGVGKTTIVLYVPENTPAGCYAVGDMNGWNVENTEFRFMPVQGVDDKRWVSCTIDYESYMKMKVLAIPNAVNVSLGWEFQWGKNMDSGNDLKEDNVVILDGVGTLLLENQGQPLLCEVADNGVVYIQVKSWTTNPPYTPNLLKGSKVWTILVDTVTAQVNASKIVADFGPDDEAGRYLYIWDNSYSVGNNWNSKNFYGVSYDYISLLVGNRGWAGCGFCLTEYDSSKAWEAAEALRTAIVANPDDYYLHMALKSTDNASHCFYIFNTGTTKFTIGSIPIQDGPIYANFTRDGEWAEFDIPMSRFATTLATITCEAGMNIFVALSEGISGAQLKMDAIYFFKKADGDNLSVQTTAPTVTTAVVTQITETSAVVGGNVTSDGNAGVTERGVVYSTNPNPVITNLNNTIRPCGSGTGEFTYTITGLQSGTTYYVRAYAKNDVGTAYGEEMSFTTKVPATPEYVDLGLSVKWATFNVGASTPEEYGDYFAWGETEPKEVYDWSTYKYWQGSESTLTKYNTDSSYGTVDNKTTLELNDDAARANWGGRWRMPTDAEMTELRTNCTWTWTTENGVNGYKVTSKSNGNSIFLPAAGYRVNSDLSNAGSRGIYWSSSLYTDLICAWNVRFDSSRVQSISNNRYCGHSVRAVYQ